VAIPAISSGVFGFPRDLCAKVILDAVLDFCVKNPMCTLSDIRLINIDSPTVQAFEEEMKTRFGAEKNFKEREGHTPEPAFVVEPKRRAFGMLKTQSPYLVTPQNIRITVKPGNLAKEQADIIVGTAASSLNLNQNPCTRALRDAAGPCLQQECSRIGQVAAGDIAVNNSPGKLRCNAVIFAVCCDWNNGGAKQVLKNLLQKCLQTASARGARSIVFPSIGTGTPWFPPVEVAKVYFDEVILFSQRNSMTTIKDVRFVPHDQDAPSIQAFYEEMKKRLPSKARLPVKRRNRFAGLASEEMNLAINTSLELVIYAGCQRDLNKAVNDIDEIMRDKSKKQVIKRGAITKLSLEHSRRIHTIELRYDVKATVESTVGRIAINGQTEDILNAMGEIHKLLDQVKEEEEEELKRV